MQNFEVIADSRQPGTLKPQLRSSTFDLTGCFRVPGDAIDELESGLADEFDSIDDLMADLNADN